MLNVTPQFAQNRTLYGVPRYVLYDVCPLRFSKSHKEICRGIAKSKAMKKGVEKKKLDKIIPRVKK